jgi:aminoglycoside 3-N-acetyltransferase
MQEIPLFQSATGEQVTRSSLLRSLEAVAAPGCETLFIHSEMSFGLPNPQLGRAALLGAIFEVLLELKIPTLVLPTFTFSFCNGEDFDRQNSRSRMGAFNEFVRRLPGAERSVDPLMSCVAMGRDMSFVRDLGHNSCGADSTFDRLHVIGGAARFLFLGVAAAKCMTYTHYVEERLGAPYRYNRPFTGRISDGEQSYLDTYNLFVRYQGVIPSSSRRFENHLIRTGRLRKVACGDSFIAAIDERAVYDGVAERLCDDIDYFLATPYPRDRLDTTFQARDMIAL